MIQIGECGNECNYILTEDNSLIIYGTGEMNEYVETTIPWKEKMINITTADINELSSIGNYAFRDCDKLTSVIISDSVKSIGNYAFYDCDKLTIYYESDETEWNNIDFGDTQKEEELKRFYYSETAPTEDGNFWHYDANGEIEVWP